MPGPDIFRQIISLIEVTEDMIGAFSSIENLPTVAYWPSRGSYARQFPIPGHLWPISISSLVSWHRLVTSSNMPGPDIFRQIISLIEVTEDMIGAFSSYGSYTVDESSFFASLIGTFCQRQSAGYDL
jgi:hypothetical protein